MELITYLLKVSVCSALFFAFYLLVLRKLTFFKINRFYLLLSLLISFTIPALKFTIEREVVQSTEITQPVAVQELEISSPDFETPTLTSTVTLDPEPEAFNWLSLLPYMYGSIVIGMFTLTILRLFRLIKHTNVPVKEINGLKLVAKETGFTNCSFFNYVFVDESSLTDKELAVLLAHEQVHAKQYHSVDKLLLMLAKAVLWFNPIIYLYDKALEEAHEYEADETTSKCIGAESYATLLLNLAVSKSQNPLLHNFVKSPIKQRIKMLFNSKSKNMKKLAYLLALPIGLGLIWGFTVDVVNVAPHQETEFTLVIDAGHGGNKKGSVVNGVAEKEITLAVSKKLKTIAEEKGIKVITTRSNDSDVSLQDRLKAKGSFLISLHVNAQPRATASNGIEMYTSTSTDKLKMNRSVGMTYNLYQSLKGLNGLAINNKPRHQRLFILENTPMPGVLLELGYLTNQKDFQFITNEKKQTELAEAIVEAVLNYKKNAKTDGEMKAMIEENTKFFDRYVAWKNSDKYKVIEAKAAKFKRSANGRIESLHYFSSQHIFDGFILNVNGERYRVYLSKEQLKQYELAVGDQIAISGTAEVWQDSDYPVIKAKEILGVRKMAYTPVKVYPKPIVHSSSSVTVNNATKVSYLKDLTMELFDGKLEAKEAEMDLLNNTITAKDAKFTTKTGTLIENDLLTFNLKTGAFASKGPNKKHTADSDAFKMLSRLSYEKTDSLRVHRIMGRALFLSGNVNMKVDNYALNAKVVSATSNSNVITLHSGSVKNGDQTPISAKTIEFNIITKELKVK